MREIKFRGKSVFNDWVYGNLLKTEQMTYIGRPKSKTSTINFLIENINTIGQYTGLKDKNGKEIYEGDIVKVPYIGSDEPENDEVIFYRGTFCLNYSEDYKPLLNEVNHCCEVIGNMYDNPNLLEGV